VMYGSKIRVEQIEELLNTLRKVVNSLEQSGNNDPTVE